jgi:hypothetical protein
MTTVREDRNEQRERKRKKFPFQPHTGLELVIISGEREGEERKKRKRDAFPVSRSEIVVQMFLLLLL